MAKAKGNLTPKQAAFVQEYLVDLNATQAAIRAGFSAATAKQIATRLLTKTHVTAAIDAAMKARSERTQISAARVLKELAHIAFFDPRRAFRDDGSLKPLAELDDDVAAAIAALEVSEIRDADGGLVGYVKKPRIADKIAALTLLARHLGLLNDKLKLQGDAENPLVVLLKQIQGNSLRPVQTPDGTTTVIETRAGNNSIGVARSAHDNDKDD